MNQASYPGIDLLNNLLSLLITIRTNKILVVGDVKQAFLQIRLSLESDKNKFSILWQTPEGVVRAFRYNTLVFGLAASPFILNYVIKHHLSNFADDCINEVLNSGFYVDNLFFTGSDVAELRNIYKGSCSRMLSGGFQLRSWFSNNFDLQEAFTNDSVGTVHETGIEKVLGYSYSPANDELKLTEIGLTEIVSITKRSVLSVTSSVFDPLGLCTPASVRSKIFLRRLWLGKFGWDDELPVSLCNEWKCLTSDLLKLHSVKFPRRVVDCNAHNILVIFCDASNEASLE